MEGNDVGRRDTVASSNEVLFFLTTLYEEEMREQYEQWLRDVDTPTVLALPGIISYRVARLDGRDVLPGADRTAFNYVEVMEVSSLAAYQAAIADAPPSLFEQFRRFIGSFEVSVGQFVN